jgi:hypothetical protein
LEQVGFKGVCRKKINKKIKKMKKLTTFFIVLFPLMVYSQPNLRLQYRLCQECPTGAGNNMLYTYGDTVTYSTTQIESDYDMRIVNQGSRFHQGIDYIPRPGCRGDGIVSPEEGTVALIGVGYGLKSIAIQSGNNAFVYLHIFEDGNIPANGMRSGNFILKSIGNNEYAIIHVITADTAIAYAERSGVQVTFLRGHRTDTVTTTNQVAQGALIAPIGNSGIPPLHLHISYLESMPANLTINGPLYHGRSNTLSVDPWVRIVHQDNGFSQRIRTRNRTGSGSDGWGNVDLSYDTNARKTLEIEVAMQGAIQGVDASRYSNTTMDQDEVALILKRVPSVGTDTNFLIARGSDYESKFILNPVGNNTIYPEHMASGTYGSPTVNGMIPSTYRDYIGFHPYDNYFIADFYPRIHRLDKLLPSHEHRLADKPWQARYKDGNFLMGSNVKDVEGTWRQIASPIQVEIDNFKPFVYGVNAYFSNGPQGNWGPAPVYSRFWEDLAGTQMRLGTRTSRAVPDPQNPGTLRLDVLTSEAINPQVPFQARIPGPFDAWVNGQFVMNATGNDGRQIWSFNMGASAQLVANTCYRIEFQGQDLAGNDLLDLEIAAQCSTNSLNLDVPHKTGENTWSGDSDTGMDRVHFIKLGLCGESTGPQQGACITGDDLKSKMFYASPGQNNGRIEVTVVGHHPDAVFKWTDINGNIIATTPSLYNVSRGEYCLEAKEGCCNVTDCFVIGECNMAITPIKQNPTVEEPNSGYIAINITNELGGNYLWSNGSTNSEQINVPAGTYCVTITDVVGCQASTCVTLVTCAPIDQGAVISAESPTSCTSNNGFIRLLSINPVGGTAPYTHGLYGPDGQLIVLPPNTYQYNNLAPGMYTLHTTDVNGCTGVTRIPLSLELLTPVLEIDYEPTCSGQSTGVISAVTGTPCTFDWNDGFHEGNIESYRENMPEGEYCVTVTSTENGCSTVGCVYVQGLTASQPLAVTAFEKKPCPKMQDGYIDLTVSGGVPPYRYVWQGVQATPYYQEDAFNLPSSGTFHVTVTDFCGSSEVRSFTFTPFNIMAIATPGCEGEGMIDVQVTGGGVPPFTYNIITWDDQQVLHTGSHVENLTSQEGIYYSVTDANQCKLQGKVDLNNSGYTYLKKATCGNLDEGEVTFHVNNPGNKNVRLVFDGTIFYNSSSAPDTFNIKVSQLQADTFFAFLTIGDCFQDSLVKIIISGNGTTHEYVGYESYNDQRMCKYQDFCDGDSLYNSFSYVSPTTDIYGEVDHKPLQRACSCKLLCGSVDVGESTFNYRRIRVGQYRAIINNMLINPAVIEQNLDILRDEDDCEWVTFCPLDMKIISTAEDLGTEPPPMVADPNNPGCYRLYCGAYSLNDESFCIHDFLPTLPNTGYVAGCSPMTATLKEMIEWHQYFINLYGVDYETSELAIWVTENMESDVAACARLRFCLNDFTIIELPDLSEIPSCEDFSVMFNIPADDSYQWEWNDEPISPLPTVPLPIQINSCQPLPQIQIEGVATPPCSVTICLDPNATDIVFYDEFDEPVYGYRSVDCNPDGPGFTGGSGDDLKFTANPSDGYQFINFGKTYLDGIGQPKGLIRNINNAYNFEYGVKTRSDIMNPLNSNVLYYINDWDTGQFFTIEKENDAKCNIKANSHDGGWTRVLTAATLNVKFFDRIDSTYYIGGSFSGSLNLQDAGVINTSQQATFLLQLSKTGVLLNSSIANGVRSLDEVFFTKLDQRIAFSAISSSTSFNMNGVVVPTDASSIVNFVTDHLSTGVVNSPIVLNSGLNLVKAVSSDLSSVVTYLLRGTGSYSLGGQVYHQDATDDYVLVTINEKGELVWTNRISAQQIPDGHLDIAYSGKLLSLGLTFTGTIYMQGQGFASKGETDIAIFNFSDSGEVSGSYHYGTTQKEQVNKLMYGQSRLYFGGEFGGNGSYRKIGKHGFVTFSNSTANPFISYVSVNESSARSEERGAMDVQDKHLNLSDAAVYPNPFNNRLYLGFKAEIEETYEVKMFNIAGNLLYSTKIFGVSGRNEIDLLPNQDIANGIYFVTLVSTSGKSWQFKAVKM